MIAQYVLGACVLVSISSLATPCVVKSSTITCQIDSSKSLQLTKDLAVNKSGVNVVLKGKEVGRYLSESNEKSQWSHLPVKALKILTSENQFSFSKEAFCAFSELTKLDFTREEFFEKPRGNLTRFPNMSCLSHLKVLKAQYNKLSGITNNTLLGLTSLQTLDLFKNKIYRIDSGAFTKHTRQLKSINLMFNKLKYLHKATFKDHPSLEQLNLENNRLKHIDGVFTSVPKLSSVYLAYNYINIVKSGTFQNLPSLDTVSLDNNFIKRLEPNALKDLPKLTYFSIDHNKLRSLDGNSMVGLPSVVRALFGYNNISHLSERAFAGMPNVKYIELWSNSLPTVNQSSFDPIFKSLNDLDIGANNVKCNCNVKWVVDLFQNKNKTFVKNLPEIILSCKSGNGKFFDLTKVTLKDIDCNNY